jgi:hypothetical protein
MIFPITELLDDHESLAWVERHFHPKGLRCPGCHTAYLISNNGRCCTDRHGSEHLLKRANEEEDAVSGAELGRV